jgi:hypothetical protein
VYAMQIVRWQGCVKLQPRFLGLLDAGWWDLPGMYELGGEQEVPSAVDFARFEGLL